MRSIILFTSLLVCMQAASANQIDIDYMQGISRRVDYAEKNQMAVWPGFHPGQNASVVKVMTESPESGHAYAINYKPGELPWQKLETDANGNPIYYLENGDSLTCDVIDGTMTTLDNQDVFIDTETRDDMKRSENFYNKYMQQRAEYYLLQQSGIDLAKIYQTLNVPYSKFNDLQIVKLIYLEESALIKSQQTDPVAAEEALRDAVAIHQYRLQLMDQGAQDYENGAEIIHDVSLYISLASSHLSDDNYRKLTQRSGCVPLISGIGIDGVSNCVQNGYPAFAASVYGHALDKKIVDGSWKKMVASQLKSISRVAMDYYHLTNEEAKMLAEQAMLKPQYDYKRIERTLDFMMKPYIANMTAAQKGYEQQPGIEFFGPDDWDSLFYGNDEQDDESDMYAIDTFTSVRQNMTVTHTIGDQGDQVSFKNMPYAFLKRVTKDNQMDVEASGVIFKISPDALITIDGVKDTAANLLAVKQNRPFKSIELADKNVDFVIHFPGMLDVSGKGLKLSYRFNSQAAQRKRK